MELQLLGSYILYTIAFLPFLTLALINILFMGAFISMHTKTMTKRSTSTNDFKKDNNNKTKNNTEKWHHPRRRRRKKENTTTAKEEEEEELLQFHSFLPDDLILYVYEYLSPKSTTTMACINRSYHHALTKETKLASALWQSLWFRDYGFTLLQWEISRKALYQSCLLYNQKQQQNSFDNDCNDDDDDDNDDDISIPSVLNVTHKLQQVFDSLPNMKRFYFEFQETYLDYCLVGCNIPSRCYLGLHGHIVNFTDFAPLHPGLVDGIISQCGGDVTTIFEQIRHSSVAKTIATKLCVLYDASCCYSANNNNNNKSHDYEQFGLKLAQQQQQTNDTTTNNSKSSWSDSNSRPPTMDDKDRTMFPTDLLAAPRRPPTLKSIRMRLAMEQNEQERQQRHRLIQLGRIYYDPFLREWKGWYTIQLNNNNNNNKWKTVLVE